MIRLPQNLKFVQGNRDDGMHTMPYMVPPYNQVNTLVGSYNLDLTNSYGDVHTTRMKMTTNTNDGVDPSMTDVPVGFRYYWDGSVAGIYTVAGSFVHKNSGVVNSGFVKFTTASGYPTNCDSAYSDIEIFNGALYVTTNDNKVYKYLNGTWSQPISLGSTDANPHMLTVYGSSSSAGRMYCTYGRTKVVSWDTSDSISTTPGTFCISTDLDMQILWIRSAASRIWIGVGSLSNTSQRRGSVIEWDGTSAFPITTHRMESSVPLSCVIKDDIPYVMDSNGRLVYWNGGTFKEVARLPYYDRWPWNTASTTNNSRYIHPNGMTINNGRINILIKNTLYENGSPTPEFIPSGVWEYDENFGLYHKYSPSYILPNSTFVKDYGQNIINAVGGISDMKVNNLASNAEGRFLAGISIYTNGSSTTAGVFCDETAVTSVHKGGNTTAVQKSGYIVTAKIASQNVTDVWQKIFVKYKKFFTNTDRMVIKYRIDDPVPQTYPITWVNGTTFTSTSDLSSYVIGDEVEIMQGLGSGMCAHITSISLLNGTTTVVIDETPTNIIASTAVARFQKWTKVGSDIFDQASQFKELAIGQTSIWIQFKIFMLWTGDGEFYELMVSNVPQTKA